MSSLVLVRSFDDGWPDAHRTFFAFSTTPVLLSREKETGEMHSFLKIYHEGRVPTYMPTSRETARTIWVELRICESHHDSAHNGRPSNAKRRLRDEFRAGANPV